MRFIWVAVTMTALSGCGTTRLANDVKPYVGRDIHELIARLGKARGERETTGNRILVWSSDSEGPLPTTSGAGYVETRPIEVRYHCSLEVTVDAHNVILSYDIEGSNAGCASLRRQLISRDS